uniref:Uncharacterized protein n=3 Tax=Setaria TaxID=4554 RepID=K3XPD4_SETIT
HHAQQRAPSRAGERAERQQPSDPSPQKQEADPMALALSGSSALRAALSTLAPRASATRGYAASAAYGAMRRAAAAAEGAAAGEAKEAGRGAAAEISWVPDPVTGHYRPANWAAAADPADLRAAHLARTYARA